MSITDQYIEATRKMQENWFSAVDAMTAQFEQKLEAPGTPMAAADPRKALDELFEFYSKALNVQHDTARKILDANLQVSDQWNAQAEQFYSAWRQQAHTMTETARHQMESFAASAREQAHQFGKAVEERVAEAQTQNREQAQRLTNAATEQAQRFTDAARQQTERVTAAATEQAERATDEATEQAKRNYNLMNTAQIKAELAARELDTKGNLDELRARLREADGQA